MRDCRRPSNYADPDGNSIELNFNDYADTWTSVEQIQNSREARLVEGEFELLHPIRTIHPPSCNSGVICAK